MTCRRLAHVLEFMGQRQTPLLDSNGVQGRQQGQFQTDRGGADLFKARITVGRKILGQQTVQTAQSCFRPSAALFVDATIATTSVA